MIASINYVGAWTLIKRELIRSWKIINQVIWPPVISTLLYVFVFGFAIGSRIQSVQGVGYAQFLISRPHHAAGHRLLLRRVFQLGLSGRRMNSIQEMLIAPMSAFEIVGGYVLGSVTRAFVIAEGSSPRSALFVVHTAPSNWGLYFLVICLVSVLFSALGVIFGLAAEKFDHIAILTTFVITPLTFVGGVFTAAEMLPPPLRAFSLFNPIFYTIDAFRRAYTGQSYLPPALSVKRAIALLAAIALATACMRMMANQV